MNRKKSKILWPGMVAVVLTLVFGIGLSACEALSDFFGGGSGSSDGSGGGGGTPLRADVSDIRRSPYDEQLTFKWTDPADADLDHIEITWEPGGTVAQTVDRGTQTYLAADLMNETVYTFTVKAVYPGNSKSGGRTVSSAFTTIGDIETYLTNVSGGDTADAPVLLPVSLNLQSDWAALLSKIQTANKFVALDLSTCTMSGTEFDPGETPIDGEVKVVSLVLPKAAKSIKAGSDNHGTFSFFTNLTSISGDNIVTVGYIAFAGCGKLEAVSLPKARFIEWQAFDGCDGLITVNIPKVENINPWAFGSINTQKEEALTVIMGSTVPTLGHQIFLYDNMSVIVQVPSGAEAWSNIIGTYEDHNDDPHNYTVNWGNGFRGGGWNGTGFQDDEGGASGINSGITLTVETYDE